MLKVKSSLLLPVLIFLSCCKQEHSDFATEHLTGNKIKVDSLHLRSYPKILVGDTLISGTPSPSANYCVSVFRNDSLITLGTVFTIGNGYGEYNSVRLGTNSEKSLNVIDVIGSGSVMRRFEQNHISNILNPTSEVHLSSYDIPEMSPLRYVTDFFVNVSDSTILINGATYDNPEHIFSIVNLKNGFVEHLDFWPEDGFKGSPLPKQSVYTDNAVILAGENKYLYKCGEERYAFLFTITGNKINVEKELFHDLPDYEEAPDGINYNLRSRSIHRLECDVNNEYIYILLIEKNSAGETAANWTESNSGNEVRVYDWDGNLNSIFILDKVGTNIRVTDDNKKLYLFSDNPTNGEKDIYSYSINEAH